MSTINLFIAIPHGRRYVITQGDVTIYTHYYLAYERWLKCHLDAKT